MSGPSDIKIEMRYNALVVAFGGITHLRFNSAKYIGHQSWRAGYGDKKFVIEITLKGGTITCDYDREDKWKAILAGLDEALGSPT